MATQHFKRNLLLNLYREGKKKYLVCFLLSLKREKNVWHLQPISSIWRPLAFLPVTLSFLLLTPFGCSYFLDVLISLFHLTLGLCQFMFHHLLLLCHVFLCSQISVVHRVIVLLNFVWMYCVIFFIIFICLVNIFSSITCLSYSLPFFICVFHRSFTILLLLLLLFTFELSFF